MYPANYWHAPFNAGWGHDKETGRLVQVCFFVTENMRDKFNEETALNMLRNHIIGTYHEAL